MITAHLEGTKEELELLLKLFPINAEDVKWLESQVGGNVGVLFRVDFKKVDRIHNAISRYGMRTRNKSVYEQAAMKKVTTLRDEGKSFQEIAQILNEKGYVTGRGKRYHPMTAKRLYDQHLLHKQED